MQTTILLLENLIIITYIVIYLKREVALEDAKSFMETLFPFGVASLPFLIIVFI